MKTLIELFDTRPLENVLAADVFHPERVVFLCPEEIARSKYLLNKFNEYFRQRGMDTEAVFAETSMFYASKIKTRLEKIAAQYPDCAIDITGGTDAALFAAGAYSTESDIPVFTYSRKKNRFFNIHNAPFAEDLHFDAKYKVEDFFLMAGGAMKQGRVDNSEINRYYSAIDEFFALYLKNKKDWVRFVTWMQRASAASKDGRYRLNVSADYYQKNTNRGRIKASPVLLRGLEKIGFIKDLEIIEETKVSFSFADELTRKWLRDVGAVLELYIYKACLDAGIFNDVHCSCVVEWEGTDSTDKVENEIDVMAVKEVIPVFISCKTCEIETYALNELSILRDRFGGETARAIIVTCEKCQTVTRQRAEALDIQIVDLNDLKAGNVSKQIADIASK